MRRLWTSFRARLVVGALIWITGGLAVSGLALSELFKEHVTAQFDSEIDGHADELAALVALTPDGQPYITHPLSDPRFQPRGSGYYWQVQADDGRAARSRSLVGQPLQLAPDPPPMGSPRRSIAEGPHGPVRVVERTAPLAGREETLRFTVGVDESILEAVLRRFNFTLALSLGLVAVGLVGAAVMQVAFGLEPLTRLRARLTEVRSGRARRLPDEVPTEVRPLVDDLNALLDANAEMIRRARTQAGNLAHGLKGPLAILADEGERLRAAGQSEAADVVLAQCERMRRHIDYQMARARAASSRSAPGSACQVEGVLAPVLAAMRRLHGARGVSFAAHVHPGLSVAVEGQDLAEMVANLIDNAGKWANSRVVVTALPSGEDQARILIDDDGPGLPPESWEVVFEVGERLDERAPGSGLGLPIVRDLATLYSGRAWLEQSQEGGLRAVLELPLAKA